VKVQTVGDVCELVTDGTHYTPPNAGSGVPFLTVKDMSKDGLDFVNCSKISAGDFASADAGNSAPKPGDVLFSKDGTVGKVHVVIDPRDFAVLSSIAILRPKRDICEPHYLGHVLKSPSIIDQAARSKTGSAIRRVILSDLRRLNFPLPPLDEQRRIAAILDKADGLRTKRREALAHLDTLTQSIFHSMFGDPDSSWPELTIEDLADRQKGAIRTGPFGSQLLTSEFTDEGIAVLGIDNAVSNQFAWKERRYISPEKYETLRRYTVRPGDLLVTIMGTLGRCAVVPSDIPPAINTKHLCCITLNREMAVPEWLHSYFLLSDAAGQYLRQTTKGAIMGGLNMGIIKKMPVLLPPLELQQTFATRVAAVERLKELHRNHLAELDALFASLQHRAFKGER
jgi:type I restriction enzyme S subunit